MEVKYNQQSQDIFLFLSPEEFGGLTKKLGDDFFSNCIKATSREAEAHFFLGHSLDKQGIFANAEGTNGIQFIHPEELEDPYLINLQTEAVTSLNTKRVVGMRYLGGAKLKIII